MVDCICHYGNDPASVRLSTPISVFVELRSHSNLPSLVNLAHSVKRQKKISQGPCNITLLPIIGVSGLLWLGLKTLEKKAAVALW